MVMEGLRVELNGYIREEFRYKNDESVAAR